MSYQLDSRTALIDRLAEDEENFRIALTMLPSKRSVVAVKMRYDAQDMLLKLAYNPHADFDIPPEPQPPSIDRERMSEDEINRLVRDYNEMKTYWKFARQANSRKVSIPDYLAIEDHFIPFDRTVHALSGIKGKEFQALTKRVEDQQKKGLLAGLSGSEGNG